MSVQPITPAGVARMTPGLLAKQAANRREGIVTHISSFNLASVQDLLDEAGTITDALDAMRTRVDDSRKSEQQAEMGRQLNRLGDLLMAASTEARMEYWRLKGYEDPRFGDES